MTDVYLTVALLVGLCGGSPKMMSDQAKPALIPKCQSNASGTAYTPTRRERIDLREVQTETMGAKGTRPLSVLILFDPRSGAYSWRVADADSNPSSRIAQFKNSQAAFLKDGKLICFMTLVSPARLAIDESSGRAANMDDAQAKALRAASEAVDPLGALDNVPDSHTVPLNSLGLDFISPPMSAQIGPPPRVVGVQWDGNKWIVTLKAQWTEEITLDAHYNLVSMRKSVRESQ